MICSSPSLVLPKLQWSHYRKYQNWELKERDPGPPFVDSVMIKAVRQLTSQRIKHSLNRNEKSVAFGKKRRENWTSISQVSWSVTLYRKGLGNCSLRKRSVTEGRVGKESSLTAIFFSPYSSLTKELGLRLSVETGPDRAGHILSRASIVCLYAAELVCTNMVIQ